MSAVVLLGFGALVVDIGRARMVRAELQNAADAGSMAGVQQLDGTAAGLEAAREAAVAFANANRAENQPVAITASDVTLGIWDRDAATFTPSEDPSLVNAVHVIARRDGITTFFAPVAFGELSLAAGAASIAWDPPVVPAGGADCYLPFAIPSCMIEQGEGALRDLDFTINPPSVDNMGWARVNEEPSADYAASVFRDCHAGGEIDLGDPIYMVEGAMTSALMALQEVLTTSATTWDPTVYGAMPPQMSGSALTPAAYGGIVEGPMIVFEGGPEYCDGSASFSTIEPLIGFVWGAVYDVRVLGAVADRTVRVRLDLERDHVMGTSEGDLDQGVYYDPPPVYTK